MRDLKLPRFELGAQLAWPPHRPVDWSSVAPVARHPGADWAVEREERARAVREEHERVTIRDYSAPQDRLVARRIFSAMMDCLLATHARAG